MSPSRHFSLTVYLTLFLSFYTVIINAASISVPSVSLEVKGGKSRSEKLSYPEKLSKALKLGQKDSLKITFDVKDSSSQKPLTVHQAFVLVKSVKDDEIETVVPCTGDNGKFQGTLDLKSNSFLESILGQSGTYSVTLLLGSFNVAKAVEYNLGNVEFDFASFVVDTAAGSKSRTVPKLQFAPLKEITHVFRPSEKMPPAVISGTFALVVLSPWILLLGLWKLFSANISNFSFHPTALVNNVGFLVSVLSILVLYYLYWTVLNLFQTLAYLAILSVPTIFLGHKSLSEHAKLREAGKL